MVGNRLSRITTGTDAGTVGYTYNNNDQLVTEAETRVVGPTTSTSTTTYGYNDNGSLVTKSKVGADPEATAYMCPPKF